MQKIKKFDRTQSLCEIYSTGFQFALLSADFEQTHAWVLCKDFMTDVIWANVNQKSASIYGFTYDAATYTPIDREVVRMVIRDKTKENKVFDKTIEASCVFLNLLEKKMKFKPTTMEKVKHPDGGSVWMSTSDKKWIHASPLFSMLTLFMRVGCHYEIGGSMNDAVNKFKQVSHNDAGYLKQSRKMRQLIIKKGLGIFQKKMEDNYPSSAGIDEIHNYWGIVNSVDTYAKSVKSLWDLKGLDTILTKKAATKKAPKKKLLKKKKKVAKKKVLANKAKKVAKKKAKKKVAKKKTTKKVGA